MSNTLNDAINRALDFHRQGEIGEAESIYVDILKQIPNQPDTLHFLGIIRHQQGRNIESEELISKSLKFAPNNLMAMSNLGTTLTALNKFEDAQFLFSKILSQQPQNWQTLTNRANSFRAQKNFNFAIRDYQNALRFNPQLFEAARNLGLCLQELGQTEEAQKALELSVSLAPQNPEAHVTIANFFRETNQFDAARLAYKSALKISPTNADIHCDFAINLRNSGKLKKAEYHFKKAIKLNPNFGRAWRGYAGVFTFSKPSQLEPIKKAVQDSENPESKMHLHFALGKAEEDLGENLKAFIQFEQANLLHAQKLEYDIQFDLNFIDALKNIINSEFIEKNTSHYVESNRPIFIVGMPRSGTSLAEQILASHSQVHGAGELSLLAGTIKQILPMSDDQNYTASLKNSTSEDFDKIGQIYLEQVKTLGPNNKLHIVDKMPMNFLHLGIIALALPNARIIHCTRNPMDSCLSIYKNHLPAYGHGYATRQETLGQYYAAYLKLMDHWMNVCGGQIYELNYEKLVTDPELQTKNLLMACGLEFEEPCLSPHNTKRVVSTLSASQVRQPIHVKSIGNWRRYETQLAPLIKALNQ